MKEKFSRHNFENSEEGPDLTEEEKHRRLEYTSQKKEGADDVPDGQLGAFQEQNPEIRDKYKRTQFSVSVLGGEAGEEIAEKLGETLTKNWFKVTTGGYDTGSMQAALKGANKAIKEMEKDPETKDILKTHADPSPKGIVAERFDPIEGAYVEENVSVEITEGEEDVYERMAKLIQNSSANVLLPGGSGTELELGAAMHLDRKLKNKFDIPQSPLIIVGDYWDDYLEEKFADEIESAENMYKVKNTEEAEDLIELLYKKEATQDEEEKQKINSQIQKHIYQLNDQ